LQQGKKLAIRQLNWRRRPGQAEVETSAISVYCDDDVRVSEG